MSCWLRRSILAFLTTICVATLFNWVAALYWDDLAQAPGQWQNAAHSMNGHGHVEQVFTGHLKGGAFGLSWWSVWNPDPTAAPCTVAGWHEGDSRPPGWRQWRHVHSLKWSRSGAGADAEVWTDRFAVRSYRVREWGVDAPSGLIALLAGLWPAWRLCRASRRWARARQKRLQARRGLCASCGYDLRASRDRCPECGTIVPPALAGETSSLPSE